jgi:hypothetical protein
MNMRSVEDRLGDLERELRDLQTVIRSLSAHQGSSVVSPLSIGLGTVPYHTHTVRVNLDTITTSGPD